MMYRALLLVLKRPRYIIPGIVTAAIIAAVTLLWPNLTLLRQVWFGDTTTWSYAGTMTWRLLIGSGESMGVLAVTLILITAGLLGLIVSMTWYVWREKRQVRSWRGLGVSTGGGMLAALLGVGCAVCGPLLLGSILALFGAAGLLLLLPLHGAELSIIAIALLVYAWYALARIITAPNTCTV